MSWDIYIQDLPDGIKTIQDIPDDFDAKPFLPRTRIAETIRELAPFTDFSEPNWWRIRCPAFSIEVNIRSDDPSPGFALHIRGGEEVLGFVHELFERLGVRALDPSSDTGLFDMEKSRQGFQRWQSYREEITKANGPL